jgi:predicted dinucleotide-binding enzyme
VPYEAALTIAASVTDWQGRTLVDATNPLAPGLAGLTLGTTTSGAENMADSRYAQGAPMMPVAGDDAAARPQVLALATLIGFDAIDMGPLSAARYLEPLAMVWIHLAFKQGQGRRFAFARMTRA